nr:putative C-type lectin domain family 20 member A [Misgurnus anguillicaudatus]
MKIVVFALLLSAHCELTTALKRQHFYFSNATTWTEAQSFCRDYYVDLSSLDTPEEITALDTASGLSGSYSDSWIGRKKISEYHWEWSDGSRRGFFNWAHGEPDNAGNDICAIVKNGQWHDRPCTDSYPYFCYKWDTELIVVKENKSWEDALQYCRTHHTDLASLPSYIYLIQARQATAETSSVWTGLRFLAGSWIWLSGRNLGDLSAQLPACPANYTYCGSLNLKNQSRENRDCMEELNFVCY